MIWIVMLVAALIVAPWWLVALPLWFGPALGLSLAIAAGCLLVVAGAVAAAAMALWRGHRDAARRHGRAGR